MKRPLKFIAVVLVFILVVTVAWLFIFRSEEGPISVEAVSDDGVLKLTMTLEKTKFTTNPREPVKIILALKNIGDDEITITFHYKSKFDFTIWDYGPGTYAYRWSYDHIGGPVGWAANVSEYINYINMTLEQPEIDTVVLRPSEEINKTLVWDHRQYQYALFLPSSTKGKYRVEGFAGFSPLTYGLWSSDYPLRFFEYISPNGTLVRTVLQTPSIDISLV